MTLLLKSLKIDKKYISRLHNDINVSRQAKNKAIFVFENTLNSLHKMSYSIYMLVIKQKRDWLDKAQDDATRKHIKTR